MIKYVVVEPNKAHVVVSMGKGRKVYHPSRQGSKSSYWFIPLIMRRIIVSLENVKHEINEIVLHDMHVAPFKCDITCWFKIEDPEKAAEKLDVDENGNIMASIRETLNAQVQGVARNAAMQQEILDLMRDRLKFGESVFTTVNGDLDDWGVKLVKLEIIDFADADGGHVIEDYEKRREAQINSTTRQVVADQQQAALVKEAEANKTAEQARIESEQIIELRDVEKLQIVETRRQEARVKVAEQAEKANKIEVLANKTKVIGEAQYTAEAKVIVAGADADAQARIAEGQKKAKVTLAEAEAEAVRVAAVADSEATTVNGTAQANVVRLKGEAEAVALEKKADAQKKFTDASKEIELTKIAADVQKVQYQSTAEALRSANIQIVSPDMNFMGFGAKEGMGLGVMANALKKVSGIDLAKVLPSKSVQEKK